MQGAGARFPGQGDCHVRGDVRGLRGCPVSQVPPPQEARSSIQANPTQGEWRRGRTQAARARAREGFPPRRAARRGAREPWQRTRRRAARVGRGQRAAARPRPSPSRLHGRAADDVTQPASRHRRDSRVTPLPRRLRVRLRLRLRLSSSPPPPPLRAALGAVGRARFCSFFLFALPTPRSRTWPPGGSLARARRGPRAGSGGGAARPSLPSRPVSSRLVSARPGRPAPRFAPPRCPPRPAPPLPAAPGPGARLPPPFASLRLRPARPPRRRREGARSERPPGRRERRRWRR